MVSIFFEMAGKLKGKKGRYETQAIISSLSLMLLHLCTFAAIHISFLGFLQSFRQHFLKCLMICFNMPPLVLLEFGIKKLKSHTSTQHSNLWWIVNTKLIFWKSYSGHQFLVMTFTWACLVESIDRHQLGGVGWGGWWRWWWGGWRPGRGVWGVVVDQNHKAVSPPSSPVDLDGRRGGGLGWGGPRLVLVQWSWPL